MDAAYVLCLGEATATDAAIIRLKRTISKLRKAFGGVKIRVRLDGGNSTPKVMQFFDELKVEHVVVIAKNSVLKVFSEPSMVEARYLSSVFRKTEHWFGECLCEAETWACAVLA